MTALQGELRDTKLEFLLDISGEIIRKMELLAVVQFEQPRELLMNVYYHLVPAIFGLTMALLTECFNQGYSTIVSVALSSL